VRSKTSEKVTSEPKLNINTTQQPAREDKRMGWKKNRQPKPSVSSTQVAVN
jgi:hypothetical protein